MKRFKSEIFKRLSFAFIAILIIPALFIVMYIYSNVTKKQEETIKKETYYTMLNTVDKISESVAKVENISILIKGDIDFLEFITTEKEKTPMEYLEFQKKFIDKYEQLISLSNEIAFFKIYTDNKKLLEIRPVIDNKLPKGKGIQDRIEFEYKDNKYYLNYFKELYFFPKSVYLEVHLDLNKIIGKSNNSYYFYKNQEIFGEDNKGKKDIERYKFKMNTEINFIRGKNHMIYYKYLPGIKGYFINYMEVTSLRVNEITYGMYIFVLLIVSLVTIYYISYWVSLKLFEQLEYVLDAVREIKKGNLEVQIPIKDKTEDFYMLSMQINSMTQRIKKLIADNVREETQSKDFQIKALQSQINSHFIQNTLETIKMIAYINKDYIVSDAITNLGKILRYGMDWSKSEVSFEEEMEYVRRYIRLFSMRLDNEIEFRYYVEDGIKDKNIPKMIFQPFVENSVLHGIIPKNAKGYIQIRAYTQEKETVLEILDNGMGLDQRGDTKGTGIGLVNTQNRLKLYFKSKVDLELKSEEGKFTRIIIKIKEM